MTTRGRGDGDRSRERRSAPDRGERRTAVARAATLPIGPCATRCPKGLRRVSAGHPMATFPSGSRRRCPGSRQSRASSPRLNSSIPRPRRLPPPSTARHCATSKPPRNSPLAPQPFANCWDSRHIALASGTRHCVSSAPSGVSPVRPPTCRSRWTSSVPSSGPPTSKRCGPPSAGSVATGTPSASARRLRVVPPRHRQREARLADHQPEADRQQARGERVAGVVRGSTRRSRLGDARTARRLYEAIQSADPGFPGLDELDRAISAL